MRAVLLFMVLFVMFLLEVDVIHLLAGIAFFDVPATVSKVGGHFALWVFFKTVIALLHG